MEQMLAQTTLQPLAMAAAAAVEAAAATPAAASLTAQRRCSRCMQSGWAGRLVRRLPAACCTRSITSARRRSPPPWLTGSSGVCPSFNDQVVATTSVPTFSMALLQINQRCLLGPSHSPSNLASVNAPTEADRNKVTHVHAERQPACYRRRLAYAVLQRRSSGKVLQLRRTAASLACSAVRPAHTQPGLHDIDGPLVCDPVMLQLHCWGNVIRVCGRSASATSALAAAPRGGGGSAVAQSPVVARQPATCNHLPQY